jgi:hypothetical protein
MTLAVVLVLVNLTVGAWGCGGPGSLESRFFVALWKPV